MTSAKRFAKNNTIMNNKYDDFINYINREENKVSQVMKKRTLYKHRVIPGHAGGTYDKENVVMLSYYFHAAAHYIRYLVFKEIGDFKAYSMMLGQTEQEKLTIAKMAGKLGGKARSKQMLEHLQNFYDPKFQKLHGYKDRGRMNVQSGFLDNLNNHITKNNPELRSKAGKFGSTAQQKIMKKDKKGFFSSTSYIQKLGNLKRWGIVINGKRIPFESLSSDFINYHIAYGTKKSY